MSVRRVGLELEGAWPTRPPGFRLDASLEGFRLPWFGEVASPPLPRAAVAAWVTEHYPHEVNGTCGLHVHVSFTEAADYAHLLRQADDLEARVIADIASWGRSRDLVPNHPLWKRLRGENSYCEPSGDHAAQAVARRKADVRRRALNFCRDIHGTLEVRVLPMFRRSALAIEAIGVVIGAVDEHIEVAA